MDMYQKRKMRAENKKNNSQEDTTKRVNINWYPGHMVKTKREIKEKIDLIDVVLEVIDGRIPYSSKNKEVDSLTNNKQKILIMTKIDLCDESETLKWKGYYEKLGYRVVLTDLINNINIKDIFKLMDNVMADLNVKRRSKGLKPRRVRALIIGVPNVGKSTLINRLVSKRAVKVGNKPGITKSLEWIRVNDKLELLDTPGILWPRLDEGNVAYNLASMTAIKEEVLDVQDIAIYIINRMIDWYPSHLAERYGVTSDDELIDILDKIGKKRGVISGGEAHYDRVYTIVLRDLRDGYLGKVTFDRVEDVI